MQPIKYIRSFANKPFRPLSQNKKKLINEILPNYTVELDKLSELKPYKVNIEIGFGDGRTLLHWAKKLPEELFIGCEPYIPGVAQLINKVEEEQLDNVLIFSQDARFLLENFSNNSINEVRVPFPDPWPKKKHHKRRLVNQTFLELVAQKLKPGGKLVIMTDDESYAECIKKNLLENKDFSYDLSAKALAKMPEHWIESKYQLKAELEGRKSRFFKLIKN